MMDKLKYNLEIQIMEEETFKGSVLKMNLIAMTIIVEFKCFKKVYL